ncbi:MAG: hypothetical protein KH366_06870 [Clostridiaceae bacterium]|nr:hypothetical protein [Clostridiaceae bacterium]
MVEGLSSPGNSCKAKLGEFAAIWMQAAVETGPDDLPVSRKLYQHSTPISEKEQGVAGFTSRKNNNPYKKAKETFTFPLPFYMDYLFFFSHSIAEFAYTAAPT